MFLAACVFLWVTSRLGVFLFGFLFGRCARKLPIIDETLPWTLHWGQVVPACGRDAAAPAKLKQEDHGHRIPAKATRPACGLPVPMQIRRICAPTALDLIAADALRSADSATAKMVTDTFDVVPGSNAALDPDLWDFCATSVQLRHATMAPSPKVARNRSTSLTKRRLSPTGRSLRR
jgi:hypothetical protein